MRMAPSIGNRSALNGLFPVVLVAVLAMCHHKPAVIDDLTRLSGQIAETLGIGRQEARPMARSLISNYGSEADDVFRTYGVPMADDVDQTIAGILARARERSEQSSFISSIACDALTRFLVNGEVPSEESLYQSMSGYVLDEYRGQAQTAVSHVIETVRAYQAGESEEVSLQVAQILYCDILLD